MRNLLGIAIPLATATLCSGQIHVQPVALSQDAAPGTAGVFRDFSALRVNSAGQVCFQGELTGGEFTGKSFSGVWRYNVDGTGGTLIAREGAAASTGTPSSFYGEHVLNDAGGVAIIGFLTTSRLAVLSGSGGTPTNVMDGNLTVNMNGSSGQWKSNIVDSLDYDVHGNIVHAGAIQSGFAFIDGVFAVRNGVLTTHLVDGQQAPGQVSGMLISDNGRSPVWAGDGAFYCSTTLTGTGTTSGTREAIYRIGADGTETMVLRRGSTVNGLPTGWTIGPITSSSLAAKGSTDITAVVDLRNASGASAGKSLIRIGPGGSSLLARAITYTTGPSWAITSPSEMDGQNLVVSGTSQIVGGIGTAAYYALDGDTGQSRLLLEDGQAMPGTPNGVTFDASGASFEIGDDGIVLVHARTEPSQSSQIMSGLWLLDANGNTNFLARESQLFDVDPSANEDLRTVSSILEWKLAPGVSAGDPSYAVFALQFADGTAGVFSATIPEPTVLGAAAAAAVMILRRRRSV